MDNPALIVLSDVLTYPRRTIREFTISEGYSQCLQNEHDAVRCTATRRKHIWRAIET